MDIHTNIPLKKYTTMQLGGSARFMGEAHTPQDVPDIYHTAQSQNLPVFILGGGSNTIVRDEGYTGVVVRNRIMGFDVIVDDETGVTIKIGAGENWDNVVRRTVEMNLTGIEAMSAIPGTAGAAPVQNIGAYGQEVSETLVSVEAYDSQTDKMVTLQNADCRFSYRDSIFRNDAKGRYVITSITLHLSKNAPQPPFYKAVEEYFAQNNISFFTPQVVRNAVIAIRKDKLPDPAEKPNAGSFFKNAIVEKWQLDEIQNQSYDVPNYDMGEGRYKIPTGWLIEQCSLKGELIHGMRIHDKNALVLINESATSYADLAAAREEIITKVRDTFRVTIEQEPLEMI